MKKIFVAVLLMGLSLAACSSQDNKPGNGDATKDVADQPKTLADVTPSKSLVDTVSYLFGISVGSQIKGYNFGDLNMSQVNKGIKDFVNAKGSFNDPDFSKQFKINPEQMNEIINRYLGMRREMTLIKNKEAGDKFLLKNKTVEGVQETESGLQYKIIEPGNDNKPTEANDTVWVRYKGTTLDGNVFDEVKAEDDSVRMVLGRVIPGWTEGMKLIGEGGKVQLFIPANLAYGEQGNMNIEPNSTLLFDVELCKVQKYVAPVVVDDAAAKKDIKKAGRK